MGYNLKVSRERWSKSFSEWFDEILWKAELYDYGRYPVKGCGVWLPYGFQLRRRIVELLRDLLDSSGHEEVLFPILIPEDLLSKEAEHIRGFGGEVFWVTHGGEEALDIKLALRPTSETIISLYENYWLKSYKQLPKKYYQIVSIFRYETKATKPMIRVREVTTFKEAHTAHESFESADEQVLEAIKIYMEFYDRLGIPYVVSKRPDWDKFAGALYTVALDTIMPDGRTLQIGTAHHLGQNFSKPFEIRIQLENENLDFIWQTSYGISERAVASVISIHGDDRGLVLPPHIAPIQVVVIPILVKGKEDQILEYASKIKLKLENTGLRVHIDDRRDVGPGAKYYEWEAKGVPVRVEVGSIELEEKTVILVRRDTLERMKVKVDSVREEVERLINEIWKHLKSRAREYMYSRIWRVKDLDEARERLANNLGIIEIPWCGKCSCGRKLEEYLNLKSLGNPVKGVEEVEVEGEECPICGDMAKTYMRLSKTY